MRCPECNEPMREARTSTRMVDGTTKRSRAWVCDRCEIRIDDGGTS